MSVFVHRARSTFPDAHAVRRDFSEAAAMLRVLADELGTAIVESVRGVRLTEKGQPMLSREQIAALTECGRCEAARFEPCRRAKAAVHPLRMEAAQAIWHAHFASPGRFGADDARLIDSFGHDLLSANDFAADHLYGEAEQDSRGTYFPVTRYTDDGDVEGTYRMRVSFEPAEQSAEGNPGAEG